MKHTQDAPVASFATPADVVFSPFQQVRSILHWLINLAEPEGDKILPLSESMCDLLNRRDRLEQGLVCCLLALHSGRVLATGRMEERKGALKSYTPSRRTG